MIKLHWYDILIRLWQVKFLHLHVRILRQRLKFFVITLVSLFRNRSWIDQLLFRHIMNESLVWKFISWCLIPQGHYSKRLQLSSRHNTQVIVFVYRSETEILLKKLFIFWFFFQKTRFCLSSDSQPSSFLLSHGLSIEGLLYWNVF